MAFETPYYMKSKTTDVGRSNQSVEDRLQRSITEIEIKQRKSILKIEQQMLKVRQEYKLLRADVDFSTDLDEHGKQIDPEACRSKSTGDLPPIHGHRGEDIRLQGTKSAPIRAKTKRRTRKKNKGVLKTEVKHESKTLTHIRGIEKVKDQEKDDEARIMSPTSTDYNPVKVEQRYLDFIDLSDKFIKSFNIDHVAKKSRKKPKDYNMMTVVSRANKALALSEDKTIKSLLVVEKPVEKLKENVKSVIIEIPTC